MTAQLFVQKSIPHKINYRKTGSGDSIMLIHGFAEDGSIWNEQVAHLAKLYTLILPDLPGSGISRTLKPSPNNTIDDFAQLILAIADEEKLDRFTLMGHSMGGYVTLAFAELFPSRLNGFGLIHSTAFADSEEKKINRTRSIEFILKFGSLLFFETMIPGLYSDKYVHENAENVQKHIHQANAFDAETLAAYYEMIKVRPDRRSVLTEFKKPILFIAGTEDKAVLLKDSLEQCYLPADHHVTLLNGVGHMGMMEAPEKVNAAIENFMASVIKK